MGNDNIIRSSHHSVTIEKGSKNAKARSAHLEEGFELGESVSKSEEMQDQIFNREIPVEEGNELQSSSNLFVEGAEVLSAAEKMAQLKAEVQRVNQNLDEDMLRTSGVPKPPIDAESASPVAPNVQNVSATERLSDAHAAVTDNALGNNVQEVMLDGTLNNSAVTLPFDISNRPRPRGAAALDALKAASALLSKAGVSQDNKAPVDLPLDQTPNTVGLQSGSSSKDNLQNAPDKTKKQLNRATTDESKSPRNLQPTALLDSQNSDNRAQITPDNRKDNRSIVEADSTNKSRASAPQSGTKKDNTQGVDEGHLEDKYAQLSEEAGSPSNVANVEAQVTKDNLQGVHSGSVKGSLESLPKSGVPKSNQASLPLGLDSGNHQTVEEGVGPGRNAQPVDEEPLISNHRGVDDSATTDNELSIDTENNKNNKASVPHKTANKAADLGVPKEHVDTNEQAIASAGSKDNLSAVPTSGLQDNNQPLEDEKSSSNNQPLEDKALLGASHGPSENHGPEHVQGIDNDDSLDNLSSIESSDSADNLAQIASESYEDNTAQVEQKSISTHLEPLPEEDTQDAGDQQDAQPVGSKDTHESDLGLAVGRLPRVGDPNEGGLIVQTNYSDNLRGREQDALKVPQNPLKNKPLASKVVKKVDKSAVKPLSRGAGAKDVPSASDTWAEAFRGRVAAINDQVKSLNKKLDDI